MICDNCKTREAVILQPHTGRKLCKECFIEDVRKRVEIEARKQGIVNSNKILLAVSGGKDSLVLADTLSQFINPSKLIAFNINEGIKGYNRSEYVKRLEEYLKDLGIELIKSGFKEEVGFSLDEMLQASLKKNLNVSACTFCGGFRRKLINEAGIKVNADYVATGHNLDDEVQTIVINLIRGDLLRLIRLGDKPLMVSSKFVMRVKPLRKIYEWETTIYAHLKGFEFQETECPYISEKPTLRAKVRELLYKLEERKPGTLLRILEQFDEISDKLKREYRLTNELPNCVICGEPTTPGRMICKNCELLIRSGLMPQEYQKYLPIS
ncbi:TIGR00269 family protein [Sulfolobus sp. E5-1-F]|uniref:TIGR00269 family protein n=1 Tax=Sulfolobaceae TaxID=118883 RepID=UPI001296B54A|nr:MULTISPECIES: TIGR00269 family protein [unclassified Sulfolobus]QGA54661.1 TIGR00269 family protein [Sulfolobus sp. E5-1-F]QGA67515.1 TIGR00269 family protein [Sulfolobus sp. E11-6]